MSDLAIRRSETALMSKQEADEIYERKTIELSRLINSKALPKHINNVDVAYMIDQMGKELGFPTLQAMHYIIPIQGRMTLSAKAIGALLRRAGIEFTCLEDAWWVYNDGKAVQDKNRGEELPVNRRTVIEFKRGAQTEVVSFYWMDAVAANLTSKDNWVRMPKEMMYARCLTKGANRIAQDIMMGLYETGELLDYLPDSETRKYKVKYNEDGGVEEAYTEAEVIK